MVGSQSIRSGAHVWLAAVLGPIVLIAMAYVLWWISDQLLIIGPLDRAQFGGLFVVPTFLAAPVVAALAWARLPERKAVVAAGLVALVLGVVAAFLFWRSVADPGCATGNRFGPGDWIVPSLLAGGLFAASVAVSGWFASGIARDGHPIWAVVAAIGVDVLILAVSLAVVGAMLSTGMCERPNPTG
jgi:hypothetical protein